MYLLKQGSFWSFLILLGLEALFGWSIWFAHWNWTVGNIAEYYQFVLIISFVVVGVIFVGYSALKQWRNIR
jgi:hypothetical protein